MNILKIFFFLILCALPAHAVDYLSSVGVQHFSISIAAASTTGTATISAVNTSRAFIVWGGNETTAITIASGHCHIQLTNSTTITATRSGTSGTITVRGCIVDASPGLIDSVEYGTVTIAAGNSTGTATISAVNANNTVLHFLGFLNADSTLAPNVQYPRLSYSGTTVTATTNTATVSNTVAGFVVIQFKGAVLNQNVQSFSTSFNGATSTTQAITSSSLNNSLIFWSGYTSSETTNNHSRSDCRHELTNATTVTLTSSGLALDITSNYFVIEFAAGVLKQANQRATIALTGVDTNTATITSVTVSNSLLSYLSASMAPQAIDRSLNSCQLTNSTTVTARKGNATSNIIASFSVAEFVPNLVGGDSGFFNLLLNYNRFKKSLKFWNDNPKELVLVD